MVRYGIAGIFESNERAYKTRKALKQEPPQLVLIAEEETIILKLTEETTADLYEQLKLIDSIYHGERYPKRHSWKERIRQLPKDIKRHPFIFLFVFVLMVLFILIGVTL